MTSLKTFCKYTSHVLNLTACTYHIPTSRKFSSQTQARCSTYPSLATRYGGGRGGRGRARQFSGHHSRLEIQRWLTNKKKEGYTHLTRLYVCPAERLTTRPSWLTNKKWDLFIYLLEAYSPINCTGSPQGFSLN